MPDELAGLDAVGQAELVRAGKVSADELIDAAITRLEQIDPQLNAVIHRNFERARREARSMRSEAPFCGVPILFKDIAAGNRAGDPYHWGTRFLRDADYRAPGTSHLVQKFLDAGFIDIGRTNVPELGAWATTEPDAYGPTRNPWNTEYASGGSSGGAAAAVASGMVPLAHASDGGGSIRNPASQCGIVGLKPSRGRVSVGPESSDAMWAGLAAELAVTRSVRDTAAVLDLVSGPMPGDTVVAPTPTRPYREEVGADPGRLRIGFVAEFPTNAGEAEFPAEALPMLGRFVEALGFVPDTPTASVHPECSTAVMRTAELLEELGHDVEPSFPAPVVAGAGVFVVPLLACSQANFVERMGVTLGRPIGEADMDADNWLITHVGQRTMGSDYLTALSGLNTFTRSMAAWWENGFDLLVTPTLTDLPPRLGALRPDPGKPLDAWMRTASLLAFTIPFNITGQPAISLPVGLSESGLPIGVQLVAGYGREDLLLRVAAQIEGAGALIGRPPIHA
ncbi:6-aminohexanoate-cyclic-dimer hydrolase [Mycolicibacterium vanbaalenii]|uniref:amidase n=1 Tax=Mycolicibacterium vanbaalenii TaxID=110539 RepID=A0A5S9R217_MYCVN|nr:amidase [Mycolicibacterium vanbaalenii]CAA0125961.1 6-aminohexanoate-cyclic-dimer hydrolase [Mycolicibacterium vanbaalenii]